MQATRGGKGKGKEPAPPAPPGDDSDTGSDNGSDDDFWSGHVIALDHCRQLDHTPQDEKSDTDRSYYAFQIAYAEVERYGIRMSSTDSGSPVCSCDEEGTCHHVTWLLEQLGRTKENIFHVGLQNVCEDLDWEFREGTGSDSEETKWQLKKDWQNSRLGRQTRGMIRERAKVVRDIMATFSTELTDHYRPDIFESPNDITEGNILVEGDLEATIARLLIVDDALFKQFRSLVSRNLRATAYFRKTGLKAFEAFQLLDQYEQLGPTSGQHDLAWCAQTLVNIVESISANVTMRQPLSPSSREEAARSLVVILKDVVKNHNYDIYQTVKWPRRRPHGEQQIDRNLYERLIGSTSRSNPSGGTFVIKALQDLPEAQRFVDDLEETLGLLETIGWGPAPQAYRDRFAALIAQLKSVPAPTVSDPTVPGPSRSSSGKRPASALERKVKRMK
jgi:hypothetical protein